MALRRKAGRNGGTKKIVSAGKQAGCSTASPVVIDGDPYAFVDSQSLQPDTQPATKLWADDHSIQSVATATGTGHLLTPMSRKKSNLTPISSSRAKTKRCSTLRYISEEERQQQEEDELLKRALEASLQEKEREDRKRRRERRELKQLQEMSVAMEMASNKRELTSQEPIKDERISEDTEDTDSTQPLTSTLSLPQAKVAIKKVDTSFIKPKKMGNTKNGANTSREDVDRLATATDQQKATEMESTDSTPPLSPEASVKITDILSTPAGNNTKMDVCEPQQLMFTEEHASMSLNSIVKDNLELTAQKSDLTTTDLKTTASSPVEHLLAVNPPPIEALSTDYTYTNHQSETSIMGKPRASGLNLSRKKRKRTSPQKILFEETQSYKSMSPLKVPQAKRAKSSQELSQANQNSEIKGQHADIEIKQVSGQHAEVISVEGASSMDETDGGVETGATSRLASKQTNCSRRLNLSVSARRNTTEYASNILHTSLTSQQPSSDIQHTSSDDHARPHTAHMQETRSSHQHTRHTYTNLCTHNPSLPQMFCPSGQCPQEHSFAIIERFNSYFSQLRVAQSRVLTRLKWGQPVKMGSSQQLCLQAGRKTRRSQMANKDTHCSLLVLPCTSRGRVQSAVRGRNFSLSESDDEVLTQPSSEGQRSPDLSENCNTSYNGIIDDGGVGDNGRMQMDVGDGGMGMDKGGLRMERTNDDLDMETISTQTHTALITPTFCDKAASSYADESLKNDPTIELNGSSTRKNRLQQKPHFSQKTSPNNWLNSRSQRVDSPSQKVNSQSKKVNSKLVSRVKNTSKNSSAKLQNTPKTRKPKTAAAKLMLEFALQSESENENLPLPTTVPTTKQTTPIKRTTPPSSAAVAEISSDEECVRLRRVSLRNRLRALSSSSESGGEPFLKDGVRAASEGGVIDLTEDKSSTPPFTDTLPSFRTKQSSSRRRKRSYQPTLIQLQRKEREVTANIGDNIDSGSDTDGPAGHNPLLDELSSALDAGESHDQREGSCDQGHSSSIGEPRLIPTADGGFMVDESTISNSPIRIHTFTKISDMAAKDQDQFRNQFKPRPQSSGRCGALNRMWSGDFGELTHLNRSGTARGRGKGRSRGNYQNGKNWKSKNFFRGRGSKSKRKPRNS